MVKSIIPVANIEIRNIPLIILKARVILPSLSICNEKYFLALSSMAETFFTGDEAMPGIFIIPYLVLNKNWPIAQISAVTPMARKDKVELSRSPE